MSVRKNRVHTRSFASPFDTSSRPIGGPVDAFGRDGDRAGHASSSRRRSSRRPGRRLVGPLRLAAAAAGPSPTELRPG